MTEITLVGAEGEEVVAVFRTDNHLSPTELCVHAGSKLPSLMEKGGLAFRWSPATKDGMMTPDGADVALHWLRRHGFRAYGEEEDWLETGSWE